MTRKRISECGCADIASTPCRVDSESFGRKPAHALQIGMNPKHLPQIRPSGGSALGLALVNEELPLTVRDAAVYLGVSVQTVYLWVERKQIPHLRVMGRNIRFLKSDLESFRATFRQEVRYAMAESMP
jgi:excisionase family DNA binding protein